VEKEVQTSICLAIRPRNNNLFLAMTRNHGGHDKHTCPNTLGVFKFRVDRKNELYNQVLQLLLGNILLVLLGKAYPEIGPMVVVLGICQVDT
jgi:hypothetical protein